MKDDAKELAKVLKDGWSVVSTGIVERRMAELGILAASVAGAGTYLGSVQTFKDPNNIESDIRATVVVISGAIPADLRAGLEDYVRGLMQDFVIGNPNLQKIREIDSNASEGT